MTRHRKPAVRVKVANKERHLFHAVERRRFGRCICFLCGRRLTNANRTDEHVIPKWLQGRFSLWNQKINLLNGTQIPYKSLKIPCCSVCNRKHLHPLEDEVCAATLAGHEAVESLLPTSLFLWLGKIFYGLLYKEIFLARDRKSGKKAPIVSKENLKAFGLHHLFLQATRTPVRFLPSIPASIFIFQIDAPHDVRLQWDYRDSFIGMTLCCRIGSVGILAALQDGGAQRDCYSNFWQPYQELQLQPIHFTELMAVFNYTASLCNRVPKFMLAEHRKQPIHVMLSSLQGLSAKPIFDEWKEEHFAHFLSIAVGLPLDQVHPAPNQVMTWLHDSRGRIHLQRDGNPDSGRFN